MLDHTSTINITVMMVGDDGDDGGGNKDGDYGNEEVE
jgi:hypothetical protein